MHQLPKFTPAWNSTFFGQFIHCTLGIGICRTGLQTAFEQDQDGQKLSTNLYDIYKCRVYSE
jgi:hypothetical protein